MSPALLSQRSTTQHSAVQYSTDQPTNPKSPCSPAAVQEPQHTADTPLSSPALRTDHRTASYYIPAFLSPHLLRCRWQPGALPSTYYRERPRTTSLTRNPPHHLFCFHHNTFPPLPMHCALPCSSRRSEPEAAATQGNQQPDRPLSESSNSRQTAQRPPPGTSGATQTDLPSAKQDVQKQATIAHSLSADPPNTETDRLSPENRRSRSDSSSWCSCSSDQLLWPHFS